MTLDHPPERGPLQLSNMESTLGIITKLMELQIIFLKENLPMPPAPPFCYTAISRTESWCRHKPLASGQSGWGVYVCPFQHRNPTVLTPVLAEIAQKAK